MKHLTTLITFLFFAHSSNLQGQVIYTYSDTGGCTSRIQTQNVPNYQNVPNKSSAKITILDFPEFDNTLSVKVDSLAEGQSLNCVLSDINGVSVSKEFVKNGVNTLETSTIKAGIYFLNIYGYEISESYKLTKK